MSVFDAPARVPRSPSLFSQVSTVAQSALPLTVVLIGNPNTGKSTLFNALSGARAMTGNYPGVTVEKKISRTTCGDRCVDLIDLPGTYSLAPRTLDEMVAVNVLLGRQTDVAAPDVVVCVVDASNIERNLYLVSQVLDLALPTVVVLNMSDVAIGRGIQIDAAALSHRLGTVTVGSRPSAHRKRGLDELRATIQAAAAVPPAVRPRIFPAAFASECARLSEVLASLGQPQTPYYLLERLLLDIGGYLEGHVVNGQAAVLASASGRRAPQAGRTGDQSPFGRGAPPVRMGAAGARGNRDADNPAARAESRSATKSTRG